MLLRRPLEPVAQPCGPWPPQGTPWQSGACTGKEVHDARLAIRVPQNCSEGHWCPLFYKFLLTLDTYTQAAMAAMKWKLAYHHSLAAVQAEIYAHHNHILGWYNRLDLAMQLETKIPTSALHLSLLTL